MVGIRSPDGLVVGSCTSHPGVLGLIPKREEPGKSGRHPVLKYRVPHGSHQARGILPVAEEQSRTRSQSGDVEDQPQCRGLWHSSPSARSLSRSPSPLPPSFTQSPSPLRSLVRDGQPSPHRRRLVVSRSTCPPLSPSPHGNSFIKGAAVINTTHCNQHWFNRVPEP